MFDDEDIKIINNFIEKRPQRLCKMCGRCCRVITTEKPYEEIKRLANEGDNAAIEFLDLFEPYPSIDAAKKVDKSTVENIIKVAEIENLTFYKCRYLKDDNLCSRYESRAVLCKLLPSTPWAVLPPGCGFEGWQFQEREAKKKLIRRQKENILRLKTDLETITSPDKIEKIKEIIAKSEEIIEIYAKYGSADW